MTAAATTKTSTIPIPNIITSLRLISDIDWAALFVLMSPAAEDGRDPFTEAVRAHPTLRLPC